MNGPSAILGRRPIFEALEARVLLSSVSGHIASNVLWDDTSEPYVLTDDLYVDPGAQLTVAAGVEVQTDGLGSYRFYVDGEVAADGASINGIEFQARTGGTLDLANCLLDNSFVAYQLGSLGTLQSDSYDSDSWELEVASSSVSVTDSEGFGATLSASASISSSWVEWLTILSGQPTVEDCTFGSAYPIEAEDPDSLANVSSNTFTDPGATITVSGTLEGTLTLTSAPGKYRLDGDLTVAAGGVLAIEPGVQVSCDSSQSYDVVVNGTLDATSADFVHVGVSAIGGQADLTDCRFTSSGITYDSLSTGTVDDCFTSGGEPLSVTVRGNGVTVANCADVSLLVSGSPTIHDNQGEYIALDGPGTPVVYQNTFSSYRPIVLLDPDASLGGFSDNTYTNEGLAILVRGDLDGPRTLAKVETISQYVMDGDLTVKPGAALELAADASVDFDGNRLFVEGTASFSDRTLTNPYISVRSGGTLNLTNCTISGGQIVYEPGSGGAVDNCTGAGGNDLQVRGDSVTVADSSNLRLTVSGSPTIDHNNLESIRLDGPGTPQVTYNLFSSEYPIRLIGATADLSGFADNTYAGTDHAILLSGTIDATTELQVVEGISDYMIDGSLTIASGATVTAASGVHIKPMPSATVYDFESGVQGWTYAYTNDYSNWGYSHDFYRTASYAHGGSYSLWGYAYVYGDYSAWYLDDWSCTYAWSPYQDLRQAGSVRASLTAFQYNSGHQSWGFSQDVRLVISDGSYEAPVMLIDHNEDPSYSMVDYGWYGTSSGSDGRTWYDFNVPLNATYFGTALAGVNLANARVGIEWQTRNWSSSPQQLWSYSAIDDVTFSGGFAASTITVEGTLTLVDQDLSGAAITVRDGGTLDLTDCKLDRGSVTFEQGSSGALNGCNAGGGSWQLSVAADGVTVANCQDISSAALSADAAITGSTLSYAVLSGGAPTITGCTFTSNAPLRFTEPDTDPSGIDSNNYTEGTNTIRIHGQLDGTVSAGPIDGIGRFQLDGTLTVATGASLTLPDTVELYLENYVLEVDGALTLNGTKVNGGYITVMQTGHADLTGCEFSQTQIEYNGASSGTVSSCQAGVESSWSLYLGSPSVTVTGCDGISVLEVSAAATITSCQIGWVDISGGAPILRDSTLTNAAAIALSEPDSDLSSVSDLTFWAEDPYIRLHGQVDGTVILGPISGLGVYRLDSTLTVAGGATLTIGPGVDLYGDGYAIQVSGTLNINGGELLGGSGALNVLSGGAATITGGTFAWPTLTAQASSTLNVSDAALGQTTVTYQSGSSGQVQNCHAGAGSWTAIIESASASIVGCTGLAYVEMKAPGTVQGSTLGYIIVNCSGQPTVTGCTLTDPLPIRYRNAAASLGGFSSNTYSAANPGISYEISTISGTAGMAVADSLGRYILPDSLMISPSGQLTIGPGVTLEQSGEGYTVTVDGVLSASSATLAVGVYVRNGTANLTDCTFQDGWSVQYGSTCVGGTIDNCSGDWGLYVYGGAFSLTGPIDVNFLRAYVPITVPDGSEIDALTLQYASTVTNSALGYVEINSAAAITIIGCTFTDDQPLRLFDLDVDLTGIHDNTFTAAHPRILLSGTRTQDWTLGPMAGLNAFALDYLGVSSSATVTIPAGTDLVPVSTGGYIDVLGGLSMSQFDFRGVPVYLYVYGVVDLFGVMIDSGSASLQSNATGSISHCQLPTLWVSAGEQVSVTDNDITGNVWAQGDPSATINLEGNWWGSAVPSEIDARIYDHNDSSWRPWVDYDPFLLSPPLTDYRGPKVISSTAIASHDGTTAGVEATFNEAIDTGNITWADLYVTGLAGAIPITGIELVNLTTYRLTFAQPADGQYELHVGPGVPDLAGNPMNQDGDTTNGELDEDAYTAPFALDSMPPEAPASVTIDNDTGSSFTDLLTSISPLTFSWSPLTDASGIDRYEYEWNGGGWTATYGTSVVLALDEGPNTFSVRGVDGVGNVGDPASMVVTLDTIPPPAPASFSLVDDTGASDGDGVTCDWTPTISWGVPADAGGIWTYVYRIDNDFSWHETTQNSLQLVPGQGVHTLYVQAFDNAGNLGPNGSYSFRIDWEGPPAPTGLTLSPDSGADPTDFVSNDDAPIVSWTAPPDQSGIWKYQYRLDGGDWSETSSTWAQVDLDEGGTIFDVRAIDVAGNVGNVASRTIHIDLTPPTIASHDPSGVSLTPVSHVDVQFSEKIDPATFTPDVITLESPSGVVASPGIGISSLGNDAYRISFTPILASGEFHVLISAEVTDWAGNSMDDPYDASFQQGLPELEMVEFTGPNQAGTGQPVQYTWTVTNNGPGAATGTWYDRVFLSRDQTISQDDRILVDQPSTGVWPLSGGSQYQRVLSASMFHDVEEGDYYLLAKTDATDVLPEGDESNNESPVAIPIHIYRPDLEMLEFTGPGQAVTGQSVQYTWKVTNSGLTAATGTWYDRVFLSNDQTISQDDRVLVNEPSTGVSPLSAGGQYQRVVWVPMIWDVQEGDYYLLAKTDATDVVPEGDESNNESPASIPIHIYAPDLRVLSVDAPGEGWAGRPATVRWTVKNFGSGSTGSSTWVDRVYLSADNVLGGDYYLGEAVCPTGLGGGDSYLQSLDVTLPALQGPYYVFVVTDAGDSVHEFGHEDNNFDYDHTPVNILPPPEPDLELVSVSTSGPLVSGQNIDVTWTVRNIGSVAAAGTAWVDSLFLSIDDSWGAGDRLMGSFVHSTPLAAGGGQYSRTETIRLPDGISGPYWLFAVTDSGNNVYERGQELNNRRSCDLTIQLQPSPDMQVIEVDAPDGLAGESLSVHWEVQNNGSGTLAGSWTDSLLLSTNSTYEPGADVYLGSFQVSGILNVGGHYERTESVVLPDRISGPYYILVMTDSGKQIPEYQSGAEDNNVGYDALQVTWNPPDLVGEITDPPAAGQSGKPLTVTWRVTNSGAGPTRSGAWTDALYLSQDQAFDRQQDYLLGTFAHSGDLGTGGSYDGSQSVSLPDGLAGQYYLFVVTDSGNIVPEGAGDDNNASAPAGPVDIALTPPPDLQVTSVTSPASAFAGQFSTIGWTVQNLGPGPTVGGDWVDRVWLSRDADWTTPGDNTFLGSFPHQGVLDASGGTDDRYTRSESVFLPAGSSGDYYVFVVTDAGNAIFEHAAEGNNGLAASDLTHVVVPTPDLAAVSVDAPAAGQSGKTVIINWRVENNGTGPTPLAASWVDEIYLSDDMAVGGDTLLGRRTRYGNLPVGQGYDESYLPTLPQGIQGLRYVYVKTDATSNVADSDRGNNTLFDLQPIDVALSPPVDLQVTQIELLVPPWSGQPLTVRWKVKNTGSGDIPSTAAWVDSLYLSSDQAVGNDTPLGTFLFSGALASQAEYAQTYAVTLPQDISGPMYLMVVTDSAGNVYEHGGETDNVAFQPMTVSQTPPADLRVSGVDTGAAGWSGQPVTISWTVTNAGSRAANSQYVRDDVYLSADDQFSPATDAFLGRAVFYGALSPGGSYQQSLRTNLPWNAQGTYRVFVVTDSDNRVPEGANENNNTGSGLLEVYATQLPDLQVSTVDAPDSAYAGQPIDVSWTVTNNGGGMTLSDRWYDAIYASVDGTLNTAGDPFLGWVLHEGTLNTGQSYSSSAKVTLPKNLLGDLYIFVRTDSTNVVLESDDANNSAFDGQPVSVALPPLADLKVAAIAAPVTGSPGGPAEVSYTILNDSTAGTLGGWWDAFYLSADANWDVNDPLIRTVQHYSALAGGAAQEVTLAVTLPAVVPGAYRLLVRTDVYNQVAETTTGEANNQGVSDSQIHLDVPRLALAVPSVGRMGPNVTEQYWAVDMPTGKSLWLVLDAQGDTSANELFVGWERLPTRSSYDYRGGTRLADAQLVAPSHASAGTYYVLVVSQRNLAEPLDYQLLAEASSIKLKDITPLRHGNGGDATVTLNGAGFDGTTTVELVASNGTTFAASTVEVKSGAQLLATFKAHAVPAGRYGVRATNGSGESSQLNDVFEVVEGGQAILDASVIVPNILGNHNAATLYVEYANTGDLAMPAPLLVLGAIQNGLSSAILTLDADLGAHGLWTDTRPKGYYGSVHILAGGDVVGLLRPGESRRIPVYYVGLLLPWSYSPVQFSLGKVQDDAPIDWNAVRQEIVPEGANPYVWSQLTSLIGDTWGDYAESLRKTAVELSNHGYDCYDGRELFANLFNRLRGVGYATVSGTVVNSQTAQPVPYAEVYLRSDDPDGAVRRVAADEQGRFSFDRVPNDRYEVSVLNYVMDEPVYADAIGDVGVTGLEVKVTPYVEKTVPDVVPNVTFDSPQLLDVEGTPHLVFVRNGQIYHTTYDGSAWQPAVAVSGAESCAPQLAYSPTLLDGTAPGLALLWQTGSGNESKIMFAVARQGVGGWQWSQPEVYNEGAVGSHNPVVAIDAQGKPLVVWQMVDGTNAQDDIDLYYGNTAMQSADLSWQDVMGILVLDSPATLTSGVTLPVGTVVALMRDGQAWVIGAAGEDEECKPGWSYKLNYEWEKEFGGTMPEGIPYIGGENKISFSCKLEGEATAAGAGIRGTLGGKVSVMQGRVEGSIEGSVGAAWKLDRATCKYVRDKMVLSGTVGLEGKIPIISYSAGFIGKVEVGIVVGGKITGTLTWTGGKRMPSGELKGLVTVGLFGDADVLGGYAVKSEFRGTGNLEITLDGDGIRLSDAYLEFSWKIRVARVYTFSGSVRWPKNSPFEQTMVFGSLEDAVSSLVTSDGIQTSTLSLTDSTGTGNVYGAHSVLAGVANDFAEDERPILVRGPDGLAYLFWQRIASEGSPDLGGTIYYATYDGSAWSAPQGIGGAAGFNRDLAAAVDSDGDIVLVWAHGDSTGLTLSSDPQVALDAYRNADLYYTELHQGAWTGPLRLADLDGEATLTFLGPDATGQLWTLWGQGGDDSKTLYASAWNGSAFAAPQAMISGMLGSSPALMTLGGKPTAIWTQVLASGSSGERQESRLFTASFENGVWGTPVELELAGFGTAEVRAAAGELSAQGNFGFEFNLDLSAPMDCCCNRPDALGAPEPFLDNFWNRFSNLVGAVDPNDKVGPAAYGDEAFVTAGQLLPYRINFENLPEATAPAQRIVITDTMDDNLDMYSLRLTEFAFADHKVTVPDGLAYYKTTVDLRPEGTQAIVEIESGLDLSTHQLITTFTAIDPATGLKVEDPTIGVLRPNDSTGRGEGHVSYSVRAKAGTVTGTTIHNRATIVFDRNEPIDTPQVVNTIDGVAPSSEVLALPSEVASPLLPISWTGGDDNGGSGLAGFDVFVSADGGPFVRWLAGATGAQALYQGQYGHSYAFYTRARDNAGNLEIAPSVPDAFTVTTTSPQITAWYGSAMHGSAVGRLGIPDDGSFVECRSAGISSLVLVFSEPIAPSSLTPSGIVVQGADANGQGVDLSGIIITTSTSDGDTRGIITFSSALPNRASYLVRVTGVTSPKGAVLTGDEDRVLTALEGDVNGDFVVDQADMDVVKAIVGAEPGYQQWNFRADLNGDGMISARDRRVILNRKGSQIARPTIQQQASAAPPAAEPATTTDHTGAEASGDISDQAAYAYSAVMVGDGAGVAQDWTVSLSAAIDRPDDIDWFRLTAPVSGTLEVQTDYAQAAGTPYVTLYEVRRDGTVSLLQLEDRGSGRASTTAVAGRQYYLEVRRDSAGQAWLDRAGYGLNLKLSQFDDYLVQTQMDLVLADMPYRGEGYSVAVIDTGIDYRHPDLAGRVILGPDLADRDSDPMDTVDHGTHVAGIIAGSNPHAPGIAGKAKVIAVKVTHDGERSTTIALVGQALQWVLDNQSKYNIAAVNLSLGGGNADKGAVVEGLEGLYAQLTARGVFISAAAGNAYAQYGVEGLSILATSENVAAVGAVWDSNVGPAAWVGGARDYTTAPDRVVSFSQRGEGLDLLAPGGDILNLRAGGGLTVKSGTSMASPMVAAASVLLREASDELHLLSFQAVGSLAINSDSSMGSPMASGTWPLLRQGDDGVHLQLTPQAMLEILRVTGKTVWDGDDENDNVPDTGRAYRRLDVLAALTALPLELTPPLGIPLTDNVP